MYIIRSTQANNMAKYESIRTSKFITQIEVDKENFVWLFECGQRRQHQ